MLLNYLSFYNSQHFQKIYRDCGTHTEKLVNVAKGISNTRPSESLSLIWIYYEYLKVKTIVSWHDANN